MDRRLVPYLTDGGHTLKGPRLLFLGPKPKQLCEGAPLSGLLLSALDGIV